MMFMNTLTLISDRSYCLWLLRGTEADTQRHIKMVKVKVIPQQAQRVPGRLRTRIFLTFGTTRVVGPQPYAPAAINTGEIPRIQFQRLGRPQVNGSGNRSRNLPTSSAVP